MNEQLPVTSLFHNVTTTKTKSTSLLGRGLVAILNQKTGLAIEDQDKRYRQARDIYNRITDYGEESRFKVELLPTQEELLKEPLLKQLQPFYNLMKQLAEVFTVFQELANQGYGRAYFPMCLMYKGGQGIAKNIEKSERYGKFAFNWCFENQILNEPEIWTDLAQLYNFGENDDLDYNESDMYCNFIKRTQISAPICLWEWYENEWVQEDDVDRWAGFDMILYRKAADKNYAHAQYMLGNLYIENCYSEQDYEVATLWFQEAAEKGYALAQYSLGWMYKDGLGVEKDYIQAEILFKKSAEQNYVKAQCSLGYLYETGCVDGWDNEAVHWYLKAAEQGYAEAQLAFGHQFRYAYHYYGNEIKRDFTKAAFWYQRASEQQNTKAQCSLGWMYETGSGVEQNNEKSVFWFCKAANRNNREAQEKLTKLGINWKET